MPDNFIFTFKASRYISHLKKFNVEAELIDKVFEPLAAFKATPCKYLVLFQVPRNVKMNIEKLENTLKLLPKTFYYAFEFRNESWFTQEIYDLLKTYNVVITLSNSPMKSDGTHLWPYYNIETANFFYTRFHESPKLYYSGYSDEELIYYAYFNNDAESFAIPNAKKLRELVAEKVTDNYMI